MTDSRETACIMFGTRIPRQLHDDMKRYCLLRDMTIAEFVADAVGERLIAAGAADRRSVGASAASYRGGLSRKRTA